MQYRVRGADRSTGSAAESVIDAPDEDGARAQASNAGLMIETITELAPPAVPAAYAVKLLTTVIDHGAGGQVIIRSKLETMLNEMAAGGWEFVAVESVRAKTLAGHGGTGRISGEDVLSDVALVVFRRAHSTLFTPAVTSTRT
jgi:hypothetical protein